MVFIAISSHNWQVWSDFEITLAVIFPNTVQEDVKTLLTLNDISTGSRRTDDTSKYSI